MTDEKNIDPAAQAAAARILKDVASSDEEARQASVEAERINKLYRELSVAQQNPRENAEQINNLIGKLNNLGEDVAPILFHSDQRRVGSDRKSDDPITHQPGFGPGEEQLDASF